MSLSHRDVKKSSTDEALGWFFEQNANKLKVYFEIVNQATRAQSSSMYSR